MYWVLNYYVYVHNITTLILYCAWINGCNYPNYYVDLKLYKWT